MEEKVNTAANFGSIDKEGRYPWGSGHGIIPLTELPARYQCPVCPKQFDVLADKKAHIRAKHPKEKKA